MQVSLGGAAQIAAGCTAGFDGRCLRRAPVVAVLSWTNMPQRTAGSAARRLALRGARGHHVSIRGHARLGRARSVSRLLVKCVPARIRACCRRRPVHKPPDFCSPCIGLERAGPILPARSCRALARGYSCRLDRALCADAAPSSSRRWGRRSLGADLRVLMPDAPDQGGTHAGWRCYLGKRVHAGRGGPSTRP